MFYRARQRHRMGFSLIELAIVLGVIGAILSAVWMAAGRVSLNQKTQKAAGQILSIVANYRTLYSQHGVDVSDNTDITCMGVTAGFFPGEMVPGGASCTASASGTTTYTGSKISNPWGGSVTVYASQSTSGIGVTYNGLMRAACNNLAAALTSTQDMIYENINGTGQQLPPYAANSPYTPAQIDGYCGTGNGNYVQVMYKAK